METEAETVRQVVGNLVGRADLAVPERLTGGASRSTWRVQDTRGSTAEPAFIVQRQRRGLDRDMSVEGRLLTAAATAQVPVPPLVGVFDADVPTLITREVVGETIARRILRDEQYAEARTRLIDQLASAAAHLHAIDPATVEGLDTVDDPVAEYRTRLDELGEPHPTFELVLRWLDVHRPPIRPVAVVHGDLRLGNVIVNDNGLAAVIDWELAHLGNPLEDLGWLCAPAWRFGGSLPVAGLGERRELLDAYAAAGGARITLDELRWWEIFSSLKWGVICIMQANAHLSGETRSHELAAIGRRVCETEHDLFVALDGLWDVADVADDAEADRVIERTSGGVVDAAVASVGAPHDRPRADELLVAVREWLASVAAGEIDSTPFHARVAANMVAIVEREHASSEMMAAAHASRLSALGVTSDAELAARIRVGGCDDQLPRVRRLVRDSVDDKLCVANPRYAARSAAGPAAAT